MKRLALLLLALLLIFSIIITGCQFFGASTKTSSATKTASAASGVLKLLSTDPTTLDPALASESTSGQYIMLIYSGLLKLDEKLEPVGDIAESWNITNDGLTYTFKLRRDVKFQNGRPVTAGDFKYSWERAVNPATGSNVARTYLGDILGVDDALAGKTTSITGVTVLDNYTLQVKIEAPKSYFLYKLSYPTAFVVDSKSVSQGTDWWRSPNNGTGPFKLSQWNQRQSLTLIRNDDYYAEKPKISSIQYSFYSGLPMDLYETGKIDVTGVSTDYIDAVMDKTGPFYNDLTVSSHLSVGYIGFNCAQPPFDDPVIRQAFSLAIDKDKIIKLIYRNMERRADGILPPGLPGYNPNVKGQAFDPAKARALVKASRYGNAAYLPSITLTTYGYGGSVSSLLQALVYQWQEHLGVTVKIRQLETERYFYKTKSEIDQLYILNWIADYPHPQNFLDVLFHSEANYNYGSYSNLQFDQLVQAASQSGDEPAGFAIYQKAEQILIDDAACIPLTFGMNYTLVKSYVNNYKTNALGFALLQDVSLANR